MVDTIKDHIFAIQEDVNKMMKIVQGCLVELNKIALRTSPLTQEDYLEMLIRSEVELKKAGYLNRIKFYQEALQSAQIISLVRGNKHNNTIFNALERLKNFNCDGDKYIARR